MAHHIPSSLSALQRLSSAVALLALGLALALLPLPVALLLVGATIAVVLALIDPVWAVCWAVLSVPVQDVVRLPGGLTVTQVTLLVAAGSWLLRTLATPQRYVRWGPLGLPLAGGVAALVLSTAFTPYSPIEGLKETLRWLWVALVYMIVINSATERRHVMMILAALLLAPTAVALYGLWQFVTASGPPSFLVAGGRFARAYGTIGQPNSFAGYMNMAWPLAVAMVFWGVRQQAIGNRRWAMGEGRGAGQSAISNLPSAIFLPSLGAAIILLAALGTSFSRGGWVGAMGGAGVLVVVWLLTGRDGASRTQIQGRLVAGACAAFVLVLLVALLNSVGVLPASVASRLDSIIGNLRLFDVRTVDVNPVNFAVVERMAHIQAGWEMFTTYPLLGVGPGNFTPAYADFAIPPWLISQGHAHNYYLHSAAEGGLVGICAYLALLVAVGRLCVGALRRASHPLDRLIVGGACGMMGAVAVHNLFENLHVLNLPIQLGAVWGLLVALQDGWTELT